MDAPDPIAARLASASTQLQRLRASLAEVIVGQRDVIDQVLAALLSGGHVLLEGAPGLGKTLLVRTLARSVDLTFSRIQFTPDLMPSDIVGTQVLLQSPDGARSFALHRGPVFCQILLADEINRASPKTQSALLEAMQEHSVTLANERHTLGPPFFVLATENPIEMEGTYPLPEAQLDRFLLKVVVHEPDENDLVQVLMRTTGHAGTEGAAVLTRDEVLSLRALCRDIVVSDPVARYAARLTKASNPAAPDAPGIVKRAVRFGAGVRGAQSLLLAAKAFALMNGAPNVSLQDVQRVAAPALRHRILRSFEGEADGVTTDQIVRALLDAVPARPEAVERALHEKPRA